MPPEWRFCPPRPRGTAAGGLAASCRCHITLPVFSGAGATSRLVPHQPALGPWHACQPPPAYEAAEHQRPLHHARVRLALAAAGAPGEVMYTSRVSGHGRSVIATPFALRGSDTYASCGGYLSGQEECGLAQR